MLADRRRHLIALAILVSCSPATEAQAGIGKSGSDASCVSQLDRANSDADVRAWFDCEVNFYKSNREMFNAYGLTPGGIGNAIAQQRGILKKTWLDHYGRKHLKKSVSLAPAYIDSEFTLQNVYGSGPASAAVPAAQPPAAKPPPSRAQPALPYQAPATPFHMVVGGGLQLRYKAGDMVSALVTFSGDAAAQKIKTIYGDLDPNPLGGQHFMTITTTAAGQHGIAKALPDVTPGHYRLRLVAIDSGGDPVTDARSASEFVVYQVAGPGGSSFHDTTIKVLPYDITKVIVSPNSVQAGQAVNVQWQTTGNAQAAGVTKLTFEVNGIQVGTSSTVEGSQTNVRIPEQVPAGNYVLSVKGVRTKAGGTAQSNGAFTVTKLVPAVATRAYQAAPSQPAPAGGRLGPASSTVQLGTSAAVHATTPPPEANYHPPTVVQPRAPAPSSTTKYADVARVMQQVWPGSASLLTPTSAAVKYAADTDMPARGGNPNALLAYLKSQNGTVKRWYSQRYGLH